MNFALLGSSPLALQVIEAIAAADEHRLLWAFVAGADERAVQQLFPEAIVHRSEDGHAGRSGSGSARSDKDSAGASAWEEVAGRADVDAVIVAGPLALLDEPLRRLAQAGKHLIFEPADRRVPVVYYELVRIEEETGSVFLPLLARRLHPALRTLREGISSGRFGRLRQVQLQRHVPRGTEERAAAGGERSPAPTRGGSGSGTPVHRAEPADVEALLWSQFAEDADLLRSLAGEFSQISVLATTGGQSAGGQAVEPGNGADSDAEANRGLCVTLAAEGGVVATWIAETTADTAGLQSQDSGASQEAASPAGTGDRAVLPDRAPAATNALRLIAQKAEATITWTNLETDCRLTLQTAGGSSTEEFGPWNPGDAMRKAFLAGVETGRSQPDLNAAIRCLEVVEAANRAARRKKAVDLSREKLTEASTFKAMMTTWGCGFLMALLPLLLLSVAVEAVDNRWLTALVRGLWYLMFACAIGYLALQLLGRVFSSADK